MRSPLLLLGLLPLLALAQTGAGPDVILQECTAKNLPFQQWTFGSKNEIILQVGF